MTPRARQVLQALVALGCAAVVSGVAWRLVGDQLSVTTDIVGSTTFNAFDIYRYFDHFLVATVLFPCLAIALYLALGRWGPLVSPQSAWAPPLLVDRVAPPSATTPSVVEPAVAAQPGHRVAGRAGLIVRLGLPALVIALEVEIGRSAQAHGLDAVAGIAAGLGYLAGVAGVTAVVLRVLRDQHLQTRTVLSLVNAVMAVATVPLLHWVSESTAVTVSASGRVVHYPWLPAWLVAVATIAALAAIALARTRGGWQAAPRVERLVLIAVIGPVALLLVTAVLQGAQMGFAAFDDAQAMTGARLLFAKGQWPWRDVFLLHGVLSDGLYGGVGTWAFGPTRWASNSGLSFFVAPFTLLGIYVFIVYFARRNYPLVLAGILAVSLGLLHDWLGTRYVLMALVLVLFDRVLRRGTWLRCIAFMAMVVLTSVVTPESTLLVLGILGTLVAAELVHRSPGQPLSEGFRRTLRCTTAGAALTAGLFVFLAASGSLFGFVFYYLSTARGTELWGTVPIHWPFHGDLESTLKFALPIALFLLTAARVAWKLQRRSPWRTVDWVLVAAATPVPLFYQLVLHRFDAPHVGEVFETVVPLVLLWGAELVRLLDAWVVRAAAWTRGALSRAGSGVTWARWLTPASAAAVVLVIALSPNSLRAWASIPDRFHPTVPTEAPTDIPLLGYTVPGTVDVSQLRDLARVVNQYAPPSAPVFDFANELGITYFLLDRLPGGHSFHIESAQTSAAQQLEIDDLERSRPPVVIFNDLTFGLPDYDGIWSMERNYLVSQYLLDHYRPIADVHGQLVMVRNDLANTAPPLPALEVPPRITDLYFADVPACNWGKVPNFLLPPRPDEVRAAVPAATGSSAPLITFKGWAFDSAAHRPPVVLAVREGSVIARTQASIRRPDVEDSRGDHAALVSGWTVSVHAAPTDTVTFYALNADGTVSPLYQPGISGDQLPSTVVDQQEIRRSVDRPGIGHVEEVTTATMADLTLPGTAQLTDYKWLEFQSESGFGSGSIQVTDQADRTELAHVMSLETMPRAGHAVYLRVGSCIQWHGYATHDLKLVLQGAPADLSVRLVP